MVTLSEKYSNFLAFYYTVFLQENEVSKGLLTSRYQTQKHKLTQAYMGVGCRHSLQTFTDETDETEQLNKLTGVSLAEGRTVNHSYSTCERCSH